MPQFIIDIKKKTVSFGSLKIGSIFLAGGSNATSDMRPPEDDSRSFVSAHDQQVYMKTYPVPTSIPTVYATAVNLMTGYYSFFNAGDPVTDADATITITPL